MSPLRLVVWTIVCIGSASVLAADTTAIYGCSYPGQRGNVLVLGARGASSYVKFGAQRIPAQHAATADGEQRWTWSNNRVSLGADSMAHYYEGGDYENAKATFRCKAMGSG